MRSRKAVLSALSTVQLRKLATLCGIKGWPRKEMLVNAIVACRVRPLRSLLEHLNRDELRALADRLSADRRARSKDELIAHITGDPRCRLRAKIIKSLRRQGFRIRRGLLFLPDQLDKDSLRALHAEAVQHKRAQAAGSLRRMEPRLLQWIADGNAIDPEKIAPTLIEVTRGSAEELLFRYASLHWTIPVSSGYGRRLRYVVIDAHHNKLMGILGLGDPVFALAPRDKWIGWTGDQRRLGLHHIVDAFALGAVPPYAHLLCGKLIAMLAASREVTHRFREKYEGRAAVISGQRRNGEIALITTNSALGRSSVYNRIKYRQTKMFVPVGFTRGSGDFQFLNGLYEEMAGFAAARLSPSAKNELWGSGFRNRREIVKKCLRAADLRPNLIYHGVRREVFVVPLASNSATFLRGEATSLDHYDWSADELFSWFRRRWLLRRAATNSDYRVFNAASYRLWPDADTACPRTRSPRGEDFQL